MSAGLVDPTELEFPVSLLAPAKLNLALYVGPTREDGRHGIASLFVPLTLGDRIVVDAATADADEVVCEGVAGPNLAGDALTVLRRLGWEPPPLRIEIEKRIPVAAGLGGGSADAAAVLRLAAEDPDRVAGPALELGADVPSQLRPAPMLVAGVGEVLEEVERIPPIGIVLIPIDPGLGAGEVYAEADRLGTPRSAGALDEALDTLREATAGGSSPLDYRELLVNDLEPAALSLRPEIGDALAALQEAGAAHTMVTGSGPTAVGLFPDVAAAQNAGGMLPPRYSGALVTSPARHLP